MALTESYPKSLIEVGFSPKQAEILNGGVDGSDNVAFLDADSTFSGDNVFSGDNTFNGYNVINGWRFYDTGDRELLKASEVGEIGTVDDYDVRILRDNSTHTVFEKTGGNGYARTILGNDSAASKDGLIMIGGETSGNLPGTWTTICDHSVAIGQCVCGTVYFSGSKDGISGSYCEVRHFHRYTYDTARETSETTVHTGGTAGGGLAFRIQHGTTSITFQAQDIGLGTYQASASVVMAAKEV